MTKINISLPPYRLSVNFRVTKRLRFSWKKVFKSTLKRAQGLEPREVRLFIHKLFAHKKIKRVLGTNLTLMLIATSFIPTHNLVAAEPQNMLIPQAEMVLKTEKATQYPVEKIRITQGYQIFHAGIDLDGITGDAIRPIKKGRVSEISRSKFAYGNAVLVDHGGEITSLYAHLSEINVGHGQEVTTDTVIGKMGATGRSFGDHLHLEIRDHGRAVNPVTVLPR